MSDVLSIDGATVRYGSKVAVDGVSLDLACGRVHALLGENGAGKSSLLRVVAGMIPPAAGRISFGQRRQGTGMMRQDAGLVAGMSVIENLALIADCQAWRIDWPDFRRRALCLLAEQGLEDVDLDCDVRELGFGQRQKVALAGLDLSGCRFLLLDEPVAALAPVEADVLLAGVRRRAGAGAGVLIASHRIEEILAVADWVHVMRNGRLSLSRPAAQTDLREVRRAIFGGRKKAVLPRPKAAADRVALELSEVVLPGFSRRINLQLAAGEIVGIAGMAGNGQNELIEVLSGFRSPASGTIRIGDEALSRGNGRRLGMRCIMEDPLADACMPDMTIAENLVLHDHGRPPYASRHGMLQGRAIAAHASRVIERVRLAARSASDPLRCLSGGNQRKLVVQRELAGAAVAVAAHNPTAGLDAAAASAVIDSLLRSCQRGAAVLLCSEDLDILSDCSTRLMVMSRGSLQQVAGSDQQRQAIEMMHGSRPPA